MYKAQVDPNSLYFDQEYSHAIILGCSIFSIFWGLINIIFIRSINVEDTKIIQKIIDESSDPENGINGDDEEKFTAEEISGKI